ncbi:MAG: hypothetical protein JSU73_12180 [candidate division WOR-3 bacterium]|nr:MAG: hypothetical protein JSU73_12180 [candidate division WOR-3 bacterium]
MRPRFSPEFGVKYILPVVSGLAGVALVLFITSKYGIGLAPDSANYVSAARSLLAGRGLLCFDRTPFTSWPPLYPLLLAVFGLGGMDVIAGARILHALAFGAIVFLSVRLLRTALKSSALVIIAALFVLFSNTLQSLSAMLLSEAVFSLLTLLFLAAAAKLLAVRTLRSLVVCSVLAALLPLQRYIGLALVLSGVVAILVWLRGWDLRRRFASAGVVLGSAVLPVAGWIARNYLLTSTLTGQRVPARRALFLNAAAVLQVVRHWFLPSLGTGWMSWVLLGLFTAALGFLMAYAWRSTRGESSTGAILTRFSLVSTVVYLAVLISAASLVAFDEVSARLFSPLYVPVVLVVFVGLERTGMLVASKLGRKRPVKAVLVLLCAVAVLHPFNWTLRFSRRFRVYGMGGYTHQEWQESPLLRWLRQNRLAGQTLSNDPAAVYLLAGKTARMSLRLTDDVAAMCSTRELKPGDHLVWFYRVERHYLYELSDLREMLPMEVLHSAEDGAVLVFRAD